MNTNQLFEYARWVVSWKTWTLWYHMVVPSRRRSKSSSSFVQHVPVMNKDGSGELGHAGTQNSIDQLVNTVTSIAMPLLLNGTL